MGLEDIAAGAKAAKQTTTAVSTGAPSKGIFAVLAAADAGGAPMFPILQVAGGNQGGGVAPIDGVPQEIADQLPQGKKPVEGILIGFRTELTSWPAKFDAQTEGDGRPSWRCAIPSADGETATLAEAATKQYQFTKSADKGIFDFDKTGIGHVRPVMQVLFWCPAIKDVVVLQNAAGYEGWIDSLRNVVKHIDAATGELPTIPVSIRVQSSPRSNNGFGWTVHSLTFEATINAAANGWLKEYQAWRSALGEDKVAQVQEWMSASDHPVNEDIKAALNKAKALRA